MTAYLIDRVILNYRQGQADFTVDFFTEENSDIQPAPALRPSSIATAICGRFPVLPAGFRE